MAVKRSKHRWGRNVLVALASLFTAGEAVVTAGIDLPGSGHIPPLVRVAGIALTVGGAWLFQQLAQRAERTHGD